VVRRSPELCDEICERIARGETLRSICREEGKPSWTTVYDWINDDPEFALRIARARDLGHDAIAEECMGIADESGAEVAVDPKTGRLVVDGEVIQRAKLRIETRIKLLAKWNPKKYGDKTQQDIQHLDAKGNPTTPPSALPASIIAKLDAVMDDEI